MKTYDEWKQTNPTDAELEHMSREPEPEIEVEVDIERMFHELEEEAELLRASREMFQLDAEKYRGESRAKDFEIARLLAEIKRLQAAMNRQIGENPRAYVAVSILQRVLAAYRNQGLVVRDNEQPITLSVDLTLNDIRMARHFVLHAGAKPADAIEHKP